MQPPELILTPEQEAQQLLEAEIRYCAQALGQGIAGLPAMVGKGVAPHPQHCVAAARKIVERFSGAVLQAVLHDRCQPGGTWLPIIRHDGGDTPVDLWLDGKRRCGFALKDRRWVREEWRGEAGTAHTVTVALSGYPTHFMPIPGAPDGIEPLGAPEGSA